MGLVRFRENLGDFMGLGSREIDPWQLELPTPGFGSRGGDPPADLTRGTQSFGRIADLSRVLKTETRGFMKISKGQSCHKKSLRKKTAFLILEALFFGSTI